MLRRIKSFIHRRLPRLAFWLGRIKGALAQRERVVAPEVDPGSFERRRLLIDVTHTSTADYLSGIQRVVLKLAEELIADGSQSAFEPVLVRLERSGDALHLMRAIEFETRVGRPQPATDRTIKIRRGDVLLMLDSSWIEYALFAKGIFPTLKAQGGKVISCVYDLIPITHPQFCVKQLALSFTRWVPIMLRSSDGIVCISKATQDSLEEYLAKQPKPFAGRIGYFHLGGDFDAGLVPVQKPSGGVPTVLMVGTLEPRKGYAIAFAAFQKLWARGHQIRLHTAGRFGWSIEALVDEMMASPQLGKNLIIDTKVSDEALREAYAQADLVLSASFAEGFGLPLVEAAAFGKSLLVSDIPAYREVCGEHAIYFATGDADDLAAKLEHWLRERPVIAPPRFITWRDSSQQLLAQIGSMVS